MRRYEWLDYSPFTSKVAGSNPSSVLGPSPHVKRAQVNALRKVVGFLRVLRFPPTGKVDRVGYVECPQLAVNS